MKGNKQYFHSLNIFSKFISETRVRGDKKTRMMVTFLLCNLAMNIDVNFTCWQLQTSTCDFYQVNAVDKQGNSLNAQIKKSGPFFERANQCFAKRGFERSSRISCMEART